MEDSSKGSKSGGIAVAVIAAVATLGAAWLAKSGNSKAEPAPAPLQQTASGAGAMNIGHDAYITNYKSPAEEGAERVQACEDRHKMKTASDSNESTETVPKSPGALGPPEQVQHVDFRTCAWPKTQFSDGDGFSQIQLKTVSGPGEYEATGTTLADRFRAPCGKLSVGYGLGVQGYFENEKHLTLRADSIVVAPDGTPWKNDGSLPFYPDEGDFTVLHNSHYRAQNAKCVE